MHMVWSIQDHTCFAHERKVCTSLNFLHVSEYAVLRFLLFETAVAVMVMVMPPYVAL